MINRWYSPHELMRRSRARASNLVLGAVLAAGLVSSVGCAAIGEMAAPEAYRSAQEFVRTSEAARAELGDVQSFGPVPTGVKLDPLGQTAQLDFTVTGTRGQGTVHVELAGEGEQWSVRSAQLTGPSGTRVELRGATPASRPS